MLFRLTFLGVMLAALVAAKRGLDAPNRQQADPNNVLYIDLEKGGRIVIQMFPEFAPKHCARIKELVRSGFYDGLTWHRVIPGFMAQGGDPQGDGRGGTRIHIPAEFTLSHHTGAVNMARYAGKPDSADSQFTIMYAWNTFLDNQYTVWGQTLGGFEHVKQLKAGDRHKDGQVTDPDRIKRICIPGDEDPTCVDEYELCSGWAMPGELGLASDQGECFNNAKWMSQHCPLACGQCKVPDTTEVPCANLYRDCDLWAAPGEFSDKGECKSNQGWMMRNCRLACDPACQGRSSEKPSV